MDTSGASGKEPSHPVQEMQEQVQSWVQEDPLKEGIAAHSIILACSPMDREAWWL